MRDRANNVDGWVDFFFPWDMSYFFESRKMETSIKVIILGCIFCGLYITSLETSQMLLKEEKGATLGDAGVLVIGAFVAYIILYLILAHTVFSVVIESIVLIVKQWRTPKLTPSKTTPEPKSISPTFEEVSAKEEIIVTVQEEPIAETLKVKTPIINLPDPTRLENYIKANAEIYSKGDGAAILYDVLLKKEVIKDNLTAYYDWLNGLIDVIGYTGLSTARARVKKQISKGKDDIIEKYDELYNEITDCVS